MTFTWLLVTATGATVLLWERSFLDLWVGDGYYPGLSAMTLIVVMVIQLAIIRTDSNIIDLTLRLSAKVMLGLLSVLLSVGLAWALLGVYGLGITGLVAGFIVGRLVLSVAYPLMIARLLGVRPSSQLRGAIRPTVATVTLLAAAAALSEHVGVGSWVMLTLACAGTVLACAAFALVVGLSAHRRSTLLNRVRRVAQLA
jgi:hypothetical protein